MLALILWIELGRRAGLLELLAEAFVCLVVLGGGGGRRVLRVFAARRRLLAPLTRAA